jgi:hypothetical protein
MLRSKKRVALIALVTFSIASASSSAFAAAGHPKGVPPQVSTVLSQLVSKGTITQAQSDAITAALTAAAPAPLASGAPSGRAGGKGHWGLGGFGKNSAAREAIITSTLGITAADLQAARQAGKTLASIAGSNTDALITALVNYDTTQIDAAVTAGTITATQATNLKANLKTLVTNEVNSVRGRGHMDDYSAKTTHRN